jgi:phosphatidylglycerol:prolipoprotein diacylglycerol transferase
MLLGLALGRVGCFLNGCCYGGICLTASYAVTFPAGSPPYAQHELGGWDTGIWLTNREGRVEVAYVATPGAAQSAGLAVGDVITAINGSQVQSLDDARHKLAQSRGALELETQDGRLLRLIAAKPPPRSVPVHAAQLYAAIDAGLLALVLWSFYPFRTRDGQVFAVMLLIHPLSRFLLESIRDDEPGQLGTRLTISQWLSAVIFLGGIALWVYIQRQPRGTVFPANTKPAVT